MSEVPSELTAATDAWRLHGPWTVTWTFGAPPVVLVVEFCSTVTLRCLRSAAPDLIPAACAALSSTDPVWRYAWALVEFVSGVLGMVAPPAGVSGVPR